MSTNPIFTDVYIETQKTAAERFLTSNYKILFRRTPIAVTSGVAEYDLPEGIIDLISVTYKGINLTPLTPLTARDRNLIQVINKTQSGTPQYYILNESSYSKIRLWPIPNENLSADPATINLSTGISEQLIVAYYRISDSNNTLPLYLRRRLTKYYIMKFAYLKEGKSQDIKAASYFNEKMQWTLKELDSFMREYYSPKFFSLGPIHPRLMRPARPVLPPNFGG